MLTCTVCLQPARRVGVRTSSRVLRCTSCGHAFITADSDELAALYGSAYEGFRPDEVFEQNVRRIYATDVLPRLSGTAEGKRALDVGCGNGTILKLSQDLGMVPVGVDVSSHSVQHCQHLGFDARRMDFGDSDFGVAQYDLITFWDVVEHLQNPRPLIAGAHRALKPGGLLLVKVPYHHWSSVFLAANIERLSSPLLQTPAHLQFFTRESLARLLGAFERFWLRPTGALRSPNRGGTLLRRAKRGTIQLLHRVLQDDSVIALAHRPRDAAS